MSIRYAPASPHRGNPQWTGRYWTPKPPADEEQIAELRELVPFELPVEYIELLRYCDGGFGELNASPLLFQMNSIAESVEHNEMWRKEGQYTDFWFIRGNGGLETIGFDLRVGPPWPIVMIDCIARDSSAERIANDITDFIERIGLPANSMANRIAQYSAQLPHSYIEFMGSHDGWEGDVGDEIGYVIIWSRESVDDCYNGYEMAKYLNDRWFPFGSDGGGEMLCFDLKSADDKVFLIPYIGMSDETPLPLCDSFAEIASAVSKGM